ncbi:hypothetical protein [Hymenobacter metallilatus]|uniref:Uncharacterized protein n=1 Tax=Hymenobacter metallilatus TaxID=2493666 RepID=A0A3R9NYJ3_9BACT|nr:hypothetical protein [Hymenobacter metallilatus]RSK23803.1 hypothetical protein EI290_22175 [Hymenobacter metallilatus]
MVDKATMRLIRSLLVQDSFLLSSKGSYSKPIVSHLRPVNLITDYPKSNVPALPKTFDITLRQLLYYKHQGIPFFSQRDSLFLIQQHQNQHTGLVDTTLFAADDFFWLQDKENRAWPKEHLDYFRFSLPLFSQDSTKAYIQMDHNCAGGCGGGVAYFLKKEKGMWRKIFAARRWFN